MKVYPTVVDKLPNEYMLRIGRVIVGWANVERILRGINYTLLGVDEKRGRVAVREPRGEDFIDMYIQLLRLAGSPHPAKLSQLRKWLKEAEPLRDLIAHGLWAQVPNNPSVYFVQRIKGNWPKKDGQRISRRERPEGVQLPITELDNLVNFIAHISTLAGEIQDEIERRLASQRKSREQSPSGHPQVGQKTKTR